MFLSINALNADNNLTDSFCLLKYFHIIQTKKRIAVSCFERVCILCQCVCQCANLKHVLSSHGVKACKLFDLMYTCRCKNTCRRKSGRTRGCTCRDDGFPCSVSCDCGPEGKPCSNRKETCSNTPADIARLPASAFDRHQEAAAKSRDEIGVR